MFFATGDGEESEPSSIQLSRLCRHIEFPEILTATKNFDESLVIGKGGFGKVYRGKVNNGENLVVAAIKRLDPESSQGPTEFWAEVKILSTLSHPNIVSLIGYCIHEKEKILLYECVPNQTLDHHLHKRRTPLSWLGRLYICIGAGLGLRYLHNDVGLDSGVIHRDFKSSNILLHESWTAKVSDFGLSKTCPKNQPSTHVSTLVKGSFGYFDPNYFRTGKLTRKSDVYAFGVVLLEVLCRKRAVEKLVDGEWRNLVTWAQDFIKERNVKHIIDSDIRGEISSKCLKEFVRITERCLHENPEHRPTIAEVVASLESIVALQEKSNMQVSGSRTIFGRMVEMLPFPSNGENSVQGDSKLLSTSKGNDKSTVRAITEVPACFQSPNSSVKEFKFSDLEKVTRNFSLDLLLGEGGFGKVFLGWVDQKTLAPSKQGVGIAVAVKRLSQYSSQGPAQWLAEVNSLGHMDHPNIIRLLGYCRDEPEHLLVYEYMPNRSFDRFLFTDVDKRLSWGTRLSIMIGAARGLTYLHSENLICRALKCGDILLDDNFNAKLGDFGLVRYGPETGETHVSTRVMGTSGYAAPEYISTGHLTTKSDIYSFGTELLVSITGRRALDTNRPSEQHILVEWAGLIQTNRRNVKEIMDPRLEHNYPLQGASECVSLALRCVANKPKDRPSSGEVLQCLEQIYAL